MEGGVPMKVQRMTLCALFAALTGLCAQLALPLGPVPINLGLLPLLTCAALLPPMWAAGSALLYLLLGAFGLPVFTGMAAGPGVLAGPTGGYLLGYVACAGLSSALIARGLRPSRAMGAGVAVCYLAGTLWLACIASMGLSQAFLTGTLPFIPGDAIKVVLACRLSSRVKATLHKNRA